MKNLYRKIIPSIKLIIYIWYKLDQDDILDISQIQIFSYNDNDIINATLADISGDEINLHQYLMSMLILKTDGVV